MHEFLLMNKLATSYHFRESVMILRRHYYTVIYVILYKYFIINYS